MFVPETISEERYNICKGCDKFIKWTRQCKSCGCILPAKVKLSFSSCPEGKWNKWEEDKQTNTWGSWGNINNTMENKGRQ